MRYLFASCVCGLRQLWTRKKPAQIIGGDLTSAGLLYTVLQPLAVHMSSGCTVCLVSLGQTPDRLHVLTSALQVVTGSLDEMGVSPLTTLDEEGRSPVITVQAIILDNTERVDVLARFADDSKQIQPFQPTSLHATSVHITSGEDFEQVNAALTAAVVSPTACLLTRFVFSFKELNGFQRVRPGNVSILNITHCVRIPDWRVDVCGRGSYFGHGAAVCCCASSHTAILTHRCCRG